MWSVDGCICSFVFTIRACSMERLAIEASMRVCLRFCLRSSHLSLTIFGREEGEGSGRDGDGDRHKEDGEMVWT